MRPLRVYVETSVFGGMFDPEFTNESRRFFNIVDAGRFRLAVSEQVQKEIIPSPDEVREFYKRKTSSIEYLDLSPEARKLARLYASNKIFKVQFHSDALHVACAAINHCAGLVSWNFKHIVNPDKIVRFNMINAANGYPQLFIVSPRGIMDHEE